MRGILQLYGFANERYTSNFVNISI